MPLIRLLVSEFIVDTDSGTLTLSAQHFNENEGLFDLPDDMPPDARIEWRERPIITVSLPADIVVTAAQGFVQYTLPDGTVATRSRTDDGTWLPPEYLWRPGDPQNGGEDDSSDSSDSGGEQHEPGDQPADQSAEEPSAPAAT